MLVWTLAKPLTVDPFDPITEILPVVLETLPAVLVSMIIAGSINGGIRSIGYHQR
jgi:hypothetical protein